MRDERRRPQVRTLFTLLATMVASSVMTGLMTGCESSPEDVLPPVFVATPLELDPTQDTPVQGWWSNDAQLLYLGEDGKYELFHDLNRYRGRESVGRWHRIRYAVVHFEPYERRQYNPIRVPVTRESGILRLNVPERDSFHQIEAPPVVLEDALIGGWTGAEGHFVLSENGRYTFDVRGSGASPVRIAGHVGTWALVDESIVLMPDLPRMGPYRFPVTVDDDGAPSVTDRDGAAYQLDTDGRN